MTITSSPPTDPVVALPVLGASPLTVVGSPHAWYPYSACGDTCRRLDPAAAAGHLLVAARLMGLVAIAALLAVTGPLAAVCPRLIRRRYLVRAARALLWSIGVSVHVDDRRPFVGGTRGLIVANHTSFLDIFALAVISPAHFVAKSDVAAMPVISGLARRLGVITIDRASLRHLPATVAEAVERLHHDSSVAVFPEGTTWCGREAGRFRPAFFQAAIDAGVPIIPVHLGFTAHDGSVTAAASLIGDDSPLDTLRRVLAARGLVVRATVHEAQLPDTDRRALALRCERLVSGAAG
ncbi:1-acyl-sn-glycerol-3-phosphate acyltransferase [Gordonia sp. HNM0687]|uniref:1-acyl-sn-glycerol-3-phosphate acyltransferase n=1 Tax=Gordonia mangrovi TaxID=2665643 RepID=A0A6L7GMY6_9ACTN|nr:lysophospholipid acyltransferase family protein [Gordonia mangrovi]MXP20893.1 1-acyl-sn-glycerol-3-phosphate acyltransferase [Gordonia mangrovi]UVF78555.1 1-acyl-sn-glycerol-3-phosphate acyltransferase [Gordonia mangrovi]